MADFQLNHLNLPAHDPEGLARWYARTFGLRAKGNKVRGPGVLLVFQPGAPIDRAPELHLGFQVPDNQKLAEWADRLGVPVSAKPGAEFNTLQVRDPEGNHLEVYCRADS